MRSDAKGTEARSTDAGQALRDICSDYYHGLLAREDYRRQRAALLNAAILGQPLPAQLKAAPLPFGAAGTTADTRAAPITRPKPPAAASEQAPATTITPSRRLPALIIAGVVGVVATAALAWWLTTDSPQAPPAPTTSDPDVAAVEATAPAPLAKENFLQRFLDGEQAWTAAGVSRFLYEWERLTATDKQGLSSTPDFERFRSELRERVQDERALGSTLETGETLENFAGLLALDLGLPPQAPKVAALASKAVAPLPDAPMVTVDATVVTPSATPARPAVAPTPVAAAPAAPKSTTPVAAVVATPPVPAQATPPPAVRKQSLCAARMANSPARGRLCNDLLADGRTGPPLIVVPAGSFQMGATDDSSARPPRQVTIRAPFAIARYEISVGEYAIFCKATGRACPQPAWPDPEAPAVGVSWNDGSEYARWLSKESGQTYRLPTEAEWEYVARGGSTTRYSSGEQPSAGQIRYADKSPLSRSAKFGQNPWWVFHMLGNVREWVADGWHPDHKGAPADGSARPANGANRVVRGGAFGDQASRVQSSSREALDAGSADDRTGFRVIRVL